MKLEMTKDGGIKLVNNEDTKALLLEAGWVVVGDEPAATGELDELKAQADALGIKYHHKSGVKKLKELIDAHGE